MYKKHECSKDNNLIDRLYGASYIWCLEDKDGRFWLTNGEYESQARFCPICGAKAPNCSSAPESEYIDTERLEELHALRRTDDD